MDYLKQLYEQAMVIRYRQHRQTFCYQECLKTEGVISQSIMYCEDGCFLYKDNEQNDAEKICEQYKYTESFFDPQVKHLKFNPDLVYEKCMLGVANMDKVFKEWKDDEIKNGPRDFVKDIKEFAEDPERVTNQRNIYYVDKRFKDKGSKAQQK